MTEAVTVLSQTQALNIILDQAKQLAEVRARIEFRDGECRYLSQRVSQLTQENDEARAAVHEAMQSTAAANEKAEAASHDAEVPRIYTPALNAGNSMCAMLLKMSSCPSFEHHERELIRTTAQAWQDAMSSYAQAGRMFDPPAGVAS